MERMKTEDGWIEEIFENEPGYTPLIPEIRAVNYNVAKPKLSTLFSYPERGPYGKNSYMGNCSGLLIRDLLTFFRPKKVSDYMQGGGTCGDVCAELGVPYIGRDLNMGFDLMGDEIGESCDFAFLHPPYWNMKKYYRKQWNNGKPHPADISETGDWGEFLKQMNVCLNKIYQSVRVGGRLAVLVGDIKRRGKLYSMQREMMIPGDLENIAIKLQHNTSSEGKTYGSTNFMEIVHEYLVITLRKDPYKMAVLYSNYKVVDVREHANIQTWRDIVQAAMESLGGEASLEKVYDEIQGHKKCESNNNWQAKIRQTLQRGRDFVNKDRGTWALSWEG